MCNSLIHVCEAVHALTDRFANVEEDFCAESSSFLLLNNYFRGSCKKDVAFLRRKRCSQLFDWPPPFAFGVHAQMSRLIHTDAQQMTF